VKKRDLEKEEERETQARGRLVDDMSSYVILSIFTNLISNVNEVRDINIFEKCV